MTTAEQKMSARMKAMAPEKASVVQDLGGLGFS